MVLDANQLNNLIVSYYLFAFNLIVMDSGSTRKSGFGGSVRGVMS